MTLLEDSISPVLVGAIDEITNDRHAILSRLAFIGKKITPGQILPVKALLFFFSIMNLAKNRWQC